MTSPVWFYKRQTLFLLLLLDLKTEKIKDRMVIMTKLDLLSFMKVILSAVLGARPDFVPLVDRSNQCFRIQELYMKAHIFIAYFLADIKSLLLLYSH